MAPINFSLDPIKVPGILAAKAWIRGGSSNDPSGQKGAHQLLGSLMTRGCGPYDNIEIANLVEGLGAGLRCEAYEDGLLISLKCASCDSEHLLSLIGWMISDPHLDEDQIKLEKKLSLQALERQKENPFQLAFDGWRTLAYGNGPYGHDPLGISKDIKEIDNSCLLHLAKNIKGKEKFIALAGTLPTDLENKIRGMKAFHGLLTNSRTEIISSDDNKMMSLPKRNGTRITLQAEETGQVVIMLGLPTISHRHHDDLALRLMASYLGSGMSSLLFRKLREENGVAYDVGIHHPIREGAAPFLIHVSTSEEKASITIQLLKELWENLQENKISLKEMSLAKAKFKGQLAHNSQTISQRAERRAQLRAFGLDDDYDTKSLIRIDSLSPNHLQKIAGEYLNKPFLSLCGPKATINKIGYKWN